MLRLSLQKKFILVAFLSVLALTAIISVLAASKTRSALYHATERQGLMLARTVSALIVNELVYEKLGLVEEGGLIDTYMRDLYDRRELDLNFIAVLDTGQRVISHNDFSEYGKRYEGKIIEEAGRSDTVQVRKVRSAPAPEEALEFAAPLSIEGKRWGVLLFSLSLTSVEEEITNLIYLILSLSIIALAVLFVLIYFLSRRFLKPIIDLSQAMEEVEVEMGEKTIQVKGSDELSQLAESFNDMVRRIRKANDDMKIAQEKLLQSEKMATLGVLSSSVAHRINNPLGGLFNCVGMLRRQGDDPAFRESYLALVEEGLQRIRQTVSQLLSSAGSQRGEERRLEIATALSNVMRFLDYRLKKQGISLSTDIEEGLVSPCATHDLEELFLNTMLNAVQAMETGGVLSINARRAESKVVITIEDTGIGIPADQVDRVFDLFYSTKKPGEGTGVGMWMTYELIKKYKGDITLASEEGVGTRVELIIPEET